MSAGTRATLAERARDLSRRSRLARLVAAAAGLLLVLGGTVRGFDHDFPFGPFRMYATRVDPNGVSRDLRVRVVLVSGAVLDRTDLAGAPRRAELEGQLDQLRKDPQRLARLVPIYTAHLPSPARTLQLVWREHRLKDGRAQPATFSVACSVAVPT